MSKATIFNLSFNKDKPLQNLTIILTIKFIALKLFPFLPPGTSWTTRRQRTSWKARTWCKHWSFWDILSTKLRILCRVIISWYEILSMIMGLLLSLFEHSCSMKCSIVWSPCSVTYNYVQWRWVEFTRDQKQANLSSNIFIAFKCFVKCWIVWPPQFWTSSNKTKCWWSVGWNVGPLEGLKA